MAKVIVDDMHQTVVNSAYSWWRLALIGAVIGGLFWSLTWLVVHFIINPLFCSADVNALACSNSVGLSGNIANVLVATIGIGILVKFRIMRPLVIVVAAAAVLWGLAGWTDGFTWGEIVFWNVLLYSLTYLLFSWISRYNRSLPVLIAVLFVVMAARIVLTL